MPPADHIAHLAHHHWIGVAVAVWASMFSTWICIAIAIFSSRKKPDASEASDEPDLCEK